ncbi:hypothetical protein SSAG_00361 [Streptomyces sp. Mg1]|nr:hypothetical protein SSAG_00361 [Streptomyces sp. Mg1]
MGWLTAPITDGVECGESEGQAGGLRQWGNAPGAECEDRMRPSGREFDDRPGRNRSCPEGALTLRRCARCRRSAPQSS